MSKHKFSRLRLTDRQKQVIIDRINKGVFRLKDLIVEKVDLVKNPANLQSFLVIKNLDGNILEEYDVNKKNEEVELLDNGDGTMTTTVSKENEASSEDATTNTDDQTSQQESSDVEDSVIEDAVSEEPEIDNLEQENVVSKGLKMHVIATLQETLEMSMHMIPLLAGAKEKEGQMYLPMSMSCVILDISKVLFHLAKSLKHKADMRDVSKGMYYDFEIDPKVKKDTLDLLRECNEGLMELIVTVTALKSAEDGEEFMLSPGSVGMLLDKSSKMQDMYKKVHSFMHEPLSDEYYRKKEASCDYHEDKSMHSECQECDEYKSIEPQNGESSTPDQSAESDQEDQATPEETTSEDNTVAEETSKSVDESGKDSEIEKENIVEKEQVLKHLSAFAKDGKLTQEEMDSMRNLLGGSVTIDGVKKNQKTETTETPKAPEFDVAKGFEELKQMTEQGQLKTQESIEGVKKEFTEKLSTLEARMDKIEKEDVKDSNVAKGQEDPEAEQKDQGVFAGTIFKRGNRFDVV